MRVNNWDPKKLAADLQWLKDNPHFNEKPASIVEFLGSDYLNIESGIRPGVRKELINIFGEDVNPHRIALVRWGMFTGAIGIGKGLPVTSNVHTPLGWRAIGTLVEGDQVTGSDGFPTKVTGVYHRGVLPVYDVNFSDGTYLRVDADHLWTVEKKQGRDRKIVRETLDTRELASRRLKYEGNGYLYNIPMVEPVHYQNEERPLAIQPYLLGLLLGDGCMTRGTITLAGDDLEVEDYIELPDDVRMIRNERDWSFTVAYGDLKRQKSYNSNKLFAAVRGYGLDGLNSHEKFIPEDYMQASPTDRLDLLRGLMDSDGSIFGHNSVRFWSSNRTLCEQVVDIVQSLGGTCSFGEYERGEGRKTEFWVGINLPENPFRISRKADAWSPRKFRKPMRYVTSVTPAGEDNVVCIKVDAVDQLFVAEDYIVTHNTTMASVVLPYMCHWVLCLKDPQGYYDLLPGSRIAFMMMSTSEDQAKETVFGDVKARIQHSPWFANSFPYDSSLKNQIRFPKDIWILPGSSAETSFEGYNILGGILDEADSHKVTQEKDYGEAGWDTINGRIDSRFQDRGFLLTVGQMKKSNGFAAKKYKELKDDPENSHTVRMTIWESIGWEKLKSLNPDGTRISFWYDTKRKEIVSDGAAKVLGYPKHIMEIPKIYEKNFRNAPEKALRDLAGIPPQAGDAFISLTHKIEEAFERYEDIVGDSQPVSSDPRRPVLADWFVATTPLERAVHLDIGYSGSGDAAGLVMGHVSHLVTTSEGEEKPFITIDAIIRVKAGAGQEVMLSDLRGYIYDFRNRGFRIRKVTMDGFQSTDTRQQLQKKRYNVSYLSVDKSKLPYEDLRDALYEDRIAIPAYMTYLSLGDTGTLNIAYKEMSELVDTGKKVDHTASGSKDVADGLAGVVHVLMGDRKYRRSANNRKEDEPVDLAALEKAMGITSSGPQMFPVDPRSRMEGLHAPIPPSFGSSIQFPTPRGR
jgi:hypothetical protein